MVPLINICIIFFLFVDTSEAKPRADILSCWLANDLLRPVTESDTEGKFKAHIQPETDFALGSQHK